MTTRADSREQHVTSGDAWDELCKALEQGKRFVLGEGVPDTPRDRAEGFRYLTRLLAAGITVCVEHADPDHPEFGRMVDHRMKWGLDCPDCLYLYATVRGDATYRIFGNRGSANHIDIQVNYGHFASGDLNGFGTISSRNGLEIATQPDGSFELWLAAEKREGNWIRLAPNAEFVLVRQYFGDWENERPADLYIERVGPVEPAPPPSPAQMGARLERLCQWLDRSASLWESMSRNFQNLPPNSLTVFRLPEDDARAGLRGQAYGMGNFRCEPDEAVIVEFAPPRCRHWSLSLANWYWESLDFATRQTSLNGHQAELDRDGVFRAVIAHVDPGVPNWLDTTGLTAGTIAARILMAEEIPEPKFQRVKLEDLRSHLPEGTPRIDEATRAESIVRRRRAVWRRYRR